MKCAYHEHAPIEKFVIAMLHVASTNATHIIVLYCTGPSDLRAHALQVAYSVRGPTPFGRLSRVRGAQSSGHRPARHACSRAVVRRRHAAARTAAQVQSGHQSDAGHDVLFGGQLRGEDASECPVPAKVTEHENHQPT